MIRIPSRALVIATTVVVAFAQPAAAMTCPQPDPWFLQRIALTRQPDLPPGVALRSVGRAVPSDAQFPFNNSVLSWIELQNTSDTPLYLLTNAAEFQARMGYPAISWSDDDIAGSPPGMRTGDKVQSGVAYDWPSNCEVVRCDQRGWSVRREPIIVADGGFGISAGFEQRIVRKKNRPPDTPIPGDQTGTFTLLYAGRPIVVPFVVSYELNPRYDPNAGTENCGQGLTVIAFGLLGAFLLMVSSFVFAALLLMRRLVRRSRSQPRGRAV